MRLRGMRLSVTVGSVLLLFILAVAPAVAEDIPAFQFGFGQPAIEQMTEYVTGPWGYSARAVVPPIAVDGARTYIGGRDIDVFEASGDWTEFWPVSSPAHSLGDLDPYLVASRSYRWVMDLDVGPSGEVFALDQNYASVHRYSGEGVFLNGWGGRPGDRPGGFYHPVALSAAPDSSVYVLDSGPGRIQRFITTGEVLGIWNTPTGSGTDICWAIDIAADAGGVWALVQTTDSYGGYRDCRVHRYSAAGVEQGSWSLGQEGVWGTQIDVDAAGNVWVLFRSDGNPRLQRFDGGGSLLVEVSVDPGTEEFAISPDSELHVLVSQTWQAPPMGYVSYRLEVKDFGGTTLQTLGDEADMRARGTNALCRTLAVSPEGDAYTRESLDEGLVGYVAHYDPAGGLVEVVETDDYPIYDPVSDAIKFLGEDELHGTPGPDGSFYSLHDWAYDGGRWTAFVDKYAGGGQLLETMEIPGPSASGALYASGSYSCAFDPDGRLLVVLLLVDESDLPQLLWGGTVTTGGRLVRSWSSTPYGVSAYAGALALDGGSNVYVAFHFGEISWVHKYSPTGAFIGRVGEWRGESAHTESLIHSVGAMSFDDSGWLRVLDRAANRILAFAYTPGPFPDVPYWHWAKEAVRAAVEAKIVAGYDDGLYRPNEAVTRAQMAVYVSRALCHGESNVPEGPAEPTFTDVGADHWAYDHIEYCAGTGIVEGYDDGTYVPWQTVDRGQMAVYIARSIATPTGEEGLVDYDPGEWQRFSDVPTTHWAYKHIAYVAERGVVKGYPDGTYKPNAVVTRDQMAVYVGRAFGLAM